MKYSALLRGINISGKNKISMSELKTELENDKYQNVTTYLNSGNVIFEKIVHPFAPISAAASSSSVPIDSSTGSSSRKTNGNVTNTVARMIPGTANTIWIFAFCRYG